MRREYSLSLYEKSVPRSVSRFISILFFAAIVNAGGSGTELNKLATQYKTVGQAADGLKETVATKLAPAFSVLSDIGIKGISGIIDAFGKIDGQAIADKVSGWIKKAQPYWTSFKNAVVKVWGVISGVAKTLAPIFQSLGSKIGSTFKSIMDKIGSIDVESVVNKISTAINKAKPYFTEFAKTFSDIRAYEDSRILLVDDYPIL